MMKGNCCGLPFGLACTLVSAVHLSTALETLDLAALVILESLSTVQRQRAT